MKEDGYRLVQVSSPAKTIFLPLFVNCEMKLSSDISKEAKLLETSINVGKLPVVKPYD